MAADQIAHEILNSNPEYNYPNLSPQTIHNIINSLRNNKSPGKDKITALHLKKFSKKLLVQLFHIIQISLRVHYFPNAWEIAVVIPIPKHDKNKTYPSSYRPVSLLSICGKILERIILVELRKHMDTNNIIVNKQFSFRNKHSTILQLIRVIHYIANEHNKNRLTAMVLLDLIKAFDSVCHKGLLLKLHKYKFPDHILKIINSFLSDRSFMVKINKEQSRTGQLKPILFNIYINDLTENPKT